MLAGRYDDAAVDLLLVDWSDPATFVLLSSGNIGEVKREGLAFTAELRSQGASPEPEDRLDLFPHLRGAARRRPLQGRPHPGDDAEPVHGDARHGGARDRGVRAVGLRVRLVHRGGR